MLPQEALGLFVRPTKPPLAGRSANGTPLYACACPSCGAERLVDRRKIGTRCFRCSIRERNTTHGLSRHPIYKLLRSMEARCHCPSATHYRYYGGRGIAVCDEWRKDPSAFVAWAEANCYAPGMEIDRKDNDGPYAPWNCRFVQHAANSRKRSNAKCNEEQARSVKAMLTSGKSVKTAAIEAGVPYMSAWHISKGNTWREV